MPAARLAGITALTVVRWWATQHTRKHSMKRVRLKLRKMIGGNGRRWTSAQWECWRRSASRCSDETGEVADPVIVEDIEPGIYYGISNENYHAGPGVSKSQLDDIADTPALYLWRKNAPVDTTKTKTLDWEPLSTAGYLNRKNSVTALS